MGFGENFRLNPEKLIVNTGGFGYNEDLRVWGDLSYQTKATYSWFMTRFQIFYAMFVFLARASGISQFSGASLTT